MERYLSQEAHQVLGQKSFQEVRAGKRLLATPLATICQFRKVGRWAAGLYWTDRIILRARGPRQFAVMKICSVSALLRRGAFVTHVFDPLTALLTLASQCLGLTQIKVSTCGNNKFALAEAEKWKSSLIKFAI
jgi:hypothetical protein